MRATPAERYPTGEVLVADLRALETSGPMPVPDDRLWWWQLHQTVVAILNAAVPAAMWGVRHWIGRPYGSAFFLATLMLATISVTLRLNLSFTSRIHPEMLIPHRARLFPAIAVADTLLALTLLGAAARIAGDHDEIAALFLSLGVVTLASLALIEPATTRAAGLDRTVNH